MSKRTSQSRLRRKQRNQLKHSGQLAADLPSIGQRPYLRRFLILLSLVIFLASTTAFASVSKNTVAAGPQSTLESDNKFLAAKNFLKKPPKKFALVEPSNCRSVDPKRNSKPPVIQKQILAIVKNTPMEKMAADIAKKDRAVAAFIVGIAMKESKFGLYSPKKDGRDCYNYWGYRGKENTTKSGYSCFDSPSHAVNVVGKKISSMVAKGVKTPAQMISWKCGSTCAGHDPTSVQKWISDVAINYYKLNPSKISKR